MSKEPSSSVVTAGFAAVSSYPTSRLSAPFAPVDQTLAIAEADRYIGAVARGQLQLLLEQISSLQERAQKILAEVDVNRQLHRVNCRVQKRAGHIYHLYTELPEDIGREYFSILSPEEWGQPPHTFLGSYKLNDDMSWTRVDLKQSY